MIFIVMKRAYDFDEDFDEEGAIHGVFTSTTAAAEFIQDQVDNHGKSFGEFVIQPYNVTTSPMELLEKVTGHMRVIY